MIQKLDRRTKIVATLGPATGSKAVIKQLMESGLNVARINLAHGTPATQSELLKNVRDVAAALGAYTAVMIDIPGPKYRTGELENGSVVLKEGATVVITTERVKGSSKRISINLRTFPDDVKSGDRVLVADGAMELTVEKVIDGEVHCRVVSGGTLLPNRGIHVPGMRISTPFVSKQLRQNLEFALAQQPDMLALSFVSRAEDVMAVKKLIEAKGLKTPVVAKIERLQALENFEGILAASDAIMVARGDLGVDLPLERIPVLQKEIIRNSNKAGKPVITATQMLESMISAPEPTRAEVTDVANAIFDGTDAIMLSAETAVGKYPLAAVKMMVRIARETEAHLPYESYLVERAAWVERQTDELIGFNACYTADRLGAAAIVAVTESGSTVRRVTKYRPRTPVLAMAASDEVCRMLSLVWGVRAVRMPSFKSITGLFEAAEAQCKKLKLAKKDDLIVITGGIPIGVQGSTNMLKVEKIG